MSWLVEYISTLGAREALVDSTGEYDYQSISDQISAYKKVLVSTVEAGDVVAILSDYNFYSITLFFALLEIKAIIVPIVTQVDDEVKDRIKIAQCDFVTSLQDDGLLEISPGPCGSKHELIRSLKDISASGLILFSSGSTGKPKAMIHDLDRLINSYKNKKIKKLNILVFLMFDHIGGLNTLLNSFAMAARVILPKNREAYEVARLIEEYMVQVLPASPTFLNLMLIGNVAKKYDLSCLRIITYGTEPMPESLLVRLRNTFRKVRFLQTFGTSETGIAHTSSRTSDSLEMKLDDPDLQHKIINGELWLKSKTQVLGYLNAESDSFTQDGWFKTGDLVENSEDGYIKIIGRNKEVINIGGEKVLPAEVESVVMEIPEVADCTARGESNAITGQSVVVDVVLSGGTINTKDAKRLIRKYCKVHMVSYKIPTKINIIKEIKFGDRFKKIRRT